MARQITPVRIARYVLWNRDFNALVYVLSGRGAVGALGHPIQQGQLALLGPGDRITVGADTEEDSNRPALEVLLLVAYPSGNGSWPMDRS
ncbi:redox-sensitive bicupin YhaK (pirin superfamily) [Mycobacteroides chelonae]|nr:redox-sensitive bicupin YhaK (pirin superfamily) [Mycobacteroides chelonae]